MAKAFFSKVTAEKGDFGPGGGGCNHADDIVAVRLAFNPQNPAIDACCPCDLALLPQVHGGLRGGNVGARPGLHFNERERRCPGRFVIGDDVYLTRDLAPGQAAADRRHEVSGHNPIAVPLEMFYRHPLAKGAQG